MHPPHSSSSRRRFLKTTAVATAFSVLHGRHWSTVVAGELRPQSTTTSGILRIRLADYPALQSESGSVRLALNPVQGNTGPLGQFYPVIINRGPNATFYALSSRCTHQNCIVEALDAASNRMTCFCHSSIYAIDGRRIAGPATGALTRYTLATEGTEALLITIPSLGYSVTATPVAPVAGGTARLRLDFRAFRNAEYEVIYRENVDSPGVAEPFAVTADGDLDQTVFSKATTAGASLWVEPKGSAGFYSVSLRVTEI